MISSRALHSMRVCFEKLAKEEKEKRPVNQWQAPKEVVTGGLANIAGRKLMEFGGKKLMEGMEQPMSANEQEVFDKLVRTSSGPVYEQPNYDNASFNPIADIVEYDPRFKHPGIIAHELGHQALHNSLVGRIVQNPFNSVGAGLAMPLSAAIGYTGGLLNNDVATTMSTVAPALLHAPQLASEAGASLIGLKRMHELGASKETLSRAALQQLLPAFGTYAGSAIANMGVGRAAMGLGRTSRITADAITNRFADKKQRKEE